MKNVNHLPKSENKTICGVKINQNNWTIDINHCTCRNCIKISTSKDKKLKK